MTALERKLEVLDRMFAFLDRFEKGSQPSGNAVTNSTPSGVESDNVVGGSAETKSSEAPAH